MRYTVLLVPDPDGQVAVSVPALPGCMSASAAAREALAHAGEAMAVWLEAEAAAGRGPLPETREVVLAGVAEALAIIEEMRATGEVPPDWGYNVELATVEVPLRRVA